jgi:hypothetical protein
MQYQNHAPHAAAFTGPTLGERLIPHSGSDRGSSRIKSFDWLARMASIPWPPLVETAPRAEDRTVKGRLVRS